MKKLDQIQADVEKEFGYQFTEGEMAKIELAIMRKFPERKESK